MCEQEGKQLLLERTSHHEEMILEEERHREVSREEEKQRVAESRLDDKLIDSQMDVSIDVDGRTMLIFAASEGALDIVEALLKQGVEVLEDRFCMDTYSFRFVVWLSISCASPITCCR